MKLFVLTTISDSSDTYTYVIKHPRKPTDEEIKAFLIKHSSDKDKSTLYESVDHLVEVSEETSYEIPVVSPATLKKYTTCGRDE